MDSELNGGQRPASTTSTTLETTFFQFMRVRTVAAVAMIFFCLTPKGSPQSTELVLTPPMGWNSWNQFQLRIDENLMRAEADAMVASGMRDAGYQYIIVDAGWKAATRDEHGKLQGDPRKFPSGMKALADYIHSKGLKFGIYTDAGTGDCDSGAPGSGGHEAEDAATFASWGVDYIKEDWCNTRGLNAQDAYRKMSRAIAATGRAMVLSVCEWGDNKPWLWAGQFAQLWRTTGDNKDCWACGAVTKDKPGGYPRGWTLILESQLGLEQYAGPGHWNDPDMLEVGMGGLTAEESRAHFSLWAVLAAPLIAGVDLRTMSPAVRSILTNREVIAVDQDPLGHQGTRVWRDESAEVWARPLVDGGSAIVLFNTGHAAHSIGVRWKQIGRDGQDRLSVRDLWRHQDLGAFAGGFAAVVPPHGVVMLRVEK